MAPIPPFFWRMASIYLTPVLTQILTQRLSRSPSFLRTVDKMIHHIDHIPHRLEGKPVPPYMGPPPGSYAAGDPKERGIRGKWEDVVSPPEDHGEPHDWQSPFPSNGNGRESKGKEQEVLGSNSNEPRDSRESSRSKAAASSSPRSQSSSQQSQQSKGVAEAEESPQEKWRWEMKELQEKLRNGGR